MDKGYLDYSVWIDDAMRIIVKRALEHARDKGLPAEHHFFISFATYAKGVGLSEALRGRYPDEMTIVLQHQFFNLLVDDEGFSVDLSFDGVRETVAVPFAAIVAFADPSVKFGLQFRQAEHEDGEDEGEAPAKTAGKGAAKKNGNGAAGGANVVSLDQYRKQ
jgi:hypothetical protein